MTLQEAMKSGRRFRTTGYDCSWLYVNRDGKKAYECYGIIYGGKR